VSTNDDDVCEELAGSWELCIEAGGSSSVTKTRLMLFLYFLKIATFFSESGMALQRLVSGDKACHQTTSPWVESESRPCMVPIH
jgi:hypothetical protein